MTNSTSDADADLLEEAADLLEDFKAQAIDTLHEFAQDDAAFEDRNYARWKSGFDLFRMFHIVSTELGSGFNGRERPAAAARGDYVFEAVVNLHARGLRVTGEVLALMLAGFPDGALSRWRTVHEMAVTAAFIGKHGHDVAERFIAHREVQAAKAVIQYDEYHLRANLSSIDPADLAAAVARKEAWVARFGKMIGKDYGWAYPIIDSERISLFDLEKDLGLDHWRPRYRWASDDIHGAFRPMGVGLGVAEATDPVLLVGRSNSGMTDPAHMTAISMTLLNHCLPRELRTHDESVILLALRLLSDEIGQVFLAIEKTPRSAD